MPIPGRRPVLWDGGTIRIECSAGRTLSVLRTWSILRQRIMLSALRGGSL